jgi:CheY-like chemotaxis protein
MNPSDHSRAAPGAQILLVDDQVDQVEMYRYALEDAGFVVTSASTGSEAVARARDVDPDVIVLDVRLPDMTGWDVCKVLKADPRTDHIPVIVLTAAATPTLATDAANAGCAAYLLKPCYPDQLTISIRNVLATT